MRRFQECEPSPMYIGQMRERRKLRDKYVEEKKKMREDNYVYKNNKNNKNKIKERENRQGAATSSPGLNYRFGH